MSSRAEFHCKPFAQISTSVTCFELLFPQTCCSKRTARFIVDQLYRKAFSSVIAFSVYMVLYASLEVAGGANVHIPVSTLEDVGIRKCHESSLATGGDGLPS